MTTISAQTVKELRDITGAGMMDCKRALSECGGDMEAAKDWLRKKGQAIADKKATRKASEGLIFCQMADDGGAVALLELNCETDFVAKNEAFHKLGGELLGQILARAQGTESGNAEEYLKAPAPGDSGLTVSDYLRENIAKLGENMSVGKFLRLAGSGDQTHFEVYIHPPGKLGVILEVRVGNAATKENEAFKALCRDLTMHVAAAAPAHLNREEVPDEKIEREKTIYREQVLAEGKPENLVDKIVTGKLNKFFQEICLLDQTFVKEPNPVVKKHIEQVGKDVGDKIEVVRFERVKVGG